MKVGHCLHPLFHDARPGRGYGKGAEDTVEVDGEWMYMEGVAAPPPNRPPMSLDQMNRRRVLPESRASLTRAGHVLSEIVSDGAGRFQFNVSINMEEPTTNGQSSCNLT